jgi:hypothetical protein
MVPFFLLRILQLITPFRPLVSSDLGLIMLLNTSNAGIYCGDAALLNLLEIFVSLTAYFCGHIDVIEM